MMSPVARRITEAFERPVVDFFEEHIVTGQGPLEDNLRQFLRVNTMTQESAIDIALQTQSTDVPGLGGALAFRDDNSPMTTHVGRPPTDHELKLIAALVPEGVERREESLEHVKRGSVLEIASHPGRVVVHISEPLVPTHTRVLELCGTDPTGAEVDVSLWLLDQRKFSLHCFRIDQREFAGLPAIDTLRQRR